MENLSFLSPPPVSPALFVLSPVFIAPSRPFCHALGNAFLLRSLYLEACLPNHHKKPLSFLGPVPFRNKEP